MKEPTIEQYLLSTCLFTIDELNEQYGNLLKEGKKEDIKEISNKKFNEMDITVRIGYPFKQTVHYTAGDGGRGSKTSHDLYIERKDFKIEIKYLRNWKSTAGGVSNSKNWCEFQKDFNWLIEEIDKGKKNKRAFVIGWFNCVDSLSQCIQLGAGPGSKPLVNDERLAYFPFLKKLKSPTYVSDLSYNYERAYIELSLDLIGYKDAHCNCLFLGNENDVFHFAVYY